MSRSEQIKSMQLRRRRTRKTAVSVEGEILDNSLLDVCPILQLFHRRLDVAGRHPHLRQHVDILQRLGIDGMSSDESDYEEIPTNPPAAMRAPRYYVLRPRWRRDALSDWLETFDVVYNILRRESLGRRGAYSRRRVQNTTAITFSQNRSFVPCLPINAYKERWLSGRRDIEFSVVPTDAYNFRHSSEVIKYAFSSAL